MLFNCFTKYAKLSYIFFRNKIVFLTASIIRPAGYKCDTIILGQGKGHSWLKFVYIAARDLWIFDYKWR